MAGYLSKAITLRATGVQRTQQLGAWAWESDSSYVGSYLGEHMLVTVGTWTLRVIKIATVEQSFFLLYSRCSICCFLSRSFHLGCMAPACFWPCIFGRSGPPFSA